MKRKLLLTLLALTMVFACAFGFAACNLFRKLGDKLGDLGNKGEGKFTLSNVKKIEMGDSQWEVERYLGAADEKTDYQFIYYGSNYKSVVAEQEKLTEQTDKISSVDELEKLLEKELKLEEKLQTMKYEHLTVQFSGNTGSVNQVVYDAEKCEANPDRTKQSKEVNLSDTGALLYTDMTFFEITAAINYTDGSYKLVSVPQSAITVTDNTVTAAQTINWEDNWGSYSPQFSFLREYSIYCAWNDNGKAVKYTFTIEDGDTAESHSTILNISGSGHIGYYSDVAEAIRRYGGSVKKIIMGKNVVCYDATFYYFGNVESVVVENGAEIIGDGTFLSCEKLKSITLPASMKIFCCQSFSDCPALTDINYGGTKAQWKAIEKQLVRDDIPGDERVAWNYGTESFTVHCTDGDLDRNGNDIG